MIHTRTPGKFTLSCGALLLAACSGSPPETLGPVQGSLTSCPDTPNCVHTGDRHPPGTPPMHLAGPWRDRQPEEVMSAVAEALEALPRTRIVERSERYLHGESRSRIFRFVDDVEVYWPQGSGELVVRSAARMGRSDMGVNEERVERLRAHLEEAGVIQGLNSGEPPTTNESSDQTGPG